MMLVGDLVVAVILATIFYDFLGEVQTSDLVSHGSQLLSKIRRSTPQF